MLISCARFCRAVFCWSVNPTASLDVLPASVWAICYVQAADLLEELVDLAAHLADLCIQIVALAGSLLRKLLNLLRERLAVEHDHVAGREVAWIVEHLADAVEESSHRGAQAVVVKRANRLLQLNVRLLLGAGVGLVAGGPTKPFLQIGVDLLGDPADFHPCAQQDFPQLLRGPGRELHLLAKVSRRIRIGDVLAGHLQGDLVHHQGVAGHLYGAEQGHRRFSLWVLTVRGPP